MIIRILLFALLSFYYLSSSAAGYTYYGDTLKLVVLSVNDQHAKIDNYPQLKALVDEIQRTNKNVLLLSAGDNFTGNPIVDQHTEKGYPIIDLMNRTGFNASAVGNHEFDYGQEVLMRRVQQARFPFISANIKGTAGVKDLFQPYTFIELESGLRIGVISAIQISKEGIPDSHPVNLKDLVFEDGIATLEKYRHLRDSCQVFIALTHLGFEKDVELAAVMPEFDLILGGHTHTLTNPASVSNGVTIMQAGSNVKYLAKATILLVNGSVISIVPEIISINSYPHTDEEISKSLAEYNDNAELNKVIRNLDVSISGNDELGSLMTDAIVAMHKVDLAFQNNGGIRIDKLDAGPITLKDIYKLDPFGNEVIVFKLTTEEIQSLILNSFKNNANKTDLQVSGATYTVLTDKSGNATGVDIRLINGRKLKKNKMYIVGMNSYIASSYTFSHTDSGQSLFTTTAQTLIDFIDTGTILNYSGVKRAFIKR